MLALPLDAAAAANNLSRAARSRYHADSRYRLKLGQIVNIGRPWLEHFECNHLLISLPYTYGPNLEWLDLADNHVRFLWALPITAREAAYAELNGHDALEQKFDDLVEKVGGKRPLGLPEFLEAHRSAFLS